MSSLYFGVVEDNQDPLMLGRCRVRVVNLHTSDKTLLPTEDLPWAIPIQPITSAALSGIGVSPTGVLNGTWVALQALDNDEQILVMLGTLAGVPNSNQIVDFKDVDWSPNIGEDPTYIQTNSGGLLVDENGSPVTNMEYQDKYLGPISSSHYTSYKNAVGKRESGGDYSKENTFGYIGKYQMGSAALEDLGYIKKGTTKKSKGNAALNDPSVWTGKDGIIDKSTFLSNAASQEKIMDSYTKMNFDRLVKNGSITKDTPEEKASGLLAVAHNQGSGTVPKLLNGDVTTDGYGTTSTEYYNIGYKAVTGYETSERPTKENISKVASDKGQKKDPSKSKYEVTPRSYKNVDGFSDPNDIYPLKDYDKEQDVPRLARGQKIEKTLVGVKETERVTGIPIANSSVTWYQPYIPYNAQYPFNHVWYTESGHALEFDDTKDAERINIHHRAGTFLEIDSEGNQTNKVKGSKVVIVENNELIYIQGSGHVAIDGDLSILVKNALHIQVDGDANIKVSGNSITEVNGNCDIKANKVAVESLGELDIKAADSVHIEAGMDIHLKAVGMFAVDAESINFNSGLAEPASGANDIPSFSPEITLPQKITRKDKQSLVLENSDLGVEKEKIEEKIAEPVIAKEKDTEKPTQVDIKVGACGFQLPITNSLQLTANHTLSSLCKNGPFPFTDGQHGFKPDELACNLKQLCLNVIEPILDKYSYLGAKVNDCFRSAGSNTSTSSTISQHEKGEAVDFGFTKIRGDRQKFYELAKEIKNLVPFDQLLLEYTSSGSIWIHISFKVSGNRGQIMTFNNHKKYSEGLVLLV